MHMTPILNRAQGRKSFVYGTRRWARQTNGLALEVQIEPRANGRPVCSGCGRAGPGYERLPPRRCAFIPLWGIAVSLLYAPDGPIDPAAGSLTRVAGGPLAVGRLAGHGWAREVLERARTCHYPWGGCPLRMGSCVRAMQPILAGGASGIEGPRYRRTRPLATHFAARFRERPRVWSRAKWAKRPENLEENGPSLFAGRLAANSAGARKRRSGKGFSPRPSCRPACQVAGNLKAVGPTGPVGDGKSPGALEWQSDGGSRAASGACFEPDIIE